MVDAKYKRIYDMTKQGFRVREPKKNGMIFSDVYDTIEEAATSMFAAYNDALIVGIWPYEDIKIACYGDNVNEG